MGRGGLLVKDRFTKIKDLLPDKIAVGNTEQNPFNLRSTYFPINRSGSIGDM